MTAITKDPTYVALGGTLASLGGNVLATDIHGVSESIRTDRDLLENHDLRKLTGLAIVESVKLALPREKGQSAKLLKLLVQQIPDGWHRLVDHPSFQVSMQPVKESNLVKLFTFDHESTEPIEPPVSADDWEVMLERILRLNDRHIKLNDEQTAALKRAAAKVQDFFLPQLFEAAKQDFANRGEAYAALQLRMLGEILSCIRKVPNSPEVADVDDAIRKTLGKEMAIFREIAKKHSQGFQDSLLHVARQLDQRAHRRAKILARQIDNNLAATLELAETLGGIAETTTDTNQRVQTIETDVASMATGIGDIKTDVASLHETLRQQYQESIQQDVQPSTEPGRQRISNLHRQKMTDRLFVGRKTLLKNLYNGLRKEHKAAVTQTHAIHGLGGVGKSQLALQYALDHGHEYDIVWWIKSEEPSSLQTDLSELAVPLGILELGQQIEDIKAVVDAVLAKLSTTQRPWLLIYDNVESQSDLQGQLPTVAKGVRGHTIITSRNPAWNVAATIPVDKMSKTDARNLIKQRINETEVRYNASAASEIAQRLGYLPLAIEVAVAYCIAANLPLDRYSHLLDNIGLELLDENRAIDYHSIVSKAWQPSFEKAIAESEHAATVLGILVHVAADDFPAELLVDLVGGQRQLNAAIKALRQYSLVERKKGLLSMHRLVHETYRESLTKDAQTKFMESALEILARAFPTDNVMNQLSWPVTERLMPHGVAVVGSVSDDKDRGEENFLTWLLTDMGKYFQVRANYEEAETAIRRALAIQQSLHGEDHPWVATILSNLGELLKVTGQLDEAEDMCRRALAIDEAGLGPDHPKVANRLANLGSLLFIKGQFSEAESSLRRALKISETAKDPIVYEIAKCLNDLAQILHGTGKFDEAESCYRRAIELMEAEYDSNNLSFGMGISNLAGLLSDCARFDEAEEMYQRALVILESTFGSKHPVVATSLANFAVLLMKIERPDKAEPICRRALEIQLAVFGPVHANSASTYSVLGCALTANEKYDEAENVLRKALEIEKTLKVHDHRRITYHLNNLAGLLSDTDRMDEAEPLYKQALSIVAANEEAGHPLYDIVVDNYSTLLEDMSVPHEEIKRRIAEVIDERNSELDRK